MLGLAHGLVCARRLLIALAVSVLGPFVFAGELSCGSASASHSDGTTTASPGTGGQPGTGSGGSSIPSVGGMGGADSAVARPDGSIVLADCPELPCLVSAANLITSCKPSYACTTQSVGLNIARCFDNGIKILESWGSGNTPSGHIVVSVKKDGVSCYSVDLSNLDDAGATQDVLAYKDGTGEAMVTLLGTTAGDSATCPGGSPVGLPSRGGCAVAAAALGGLMPASSCLNNTTGTCQF